MTLLGVAAGFGAALLDAFNTPIVYLQAGMEWVVATLLKGLLKIPGMDELFGFDSSAVDSDWGSILNSRKEAGGDLFGIKPKEIAAAAAEIISGSAPALGDSIAAAAKKAGEFGGSDIIDTTRMKESLAGIIASIPGVGPEVEAVKAAGKSSAKSGAATTAGEVAARLEPIVTSLGKVGGGGYSTGTLDAQRENNRLTGETNRLLTDMNPQDREARRHGSGGVRLTRCPWQDAPPYLHPAGKTLSAAGIHPPDRQGGQVDRHPDLPLPPLIGRRPDAASGHPPPGGAVHRHLAGHGHLHRGRPRRNHLPVRRGGGKGRGRRKGQRGLHDGPVAQRGTAALPPPLQGHPAEGTRGDPAHPVGQGQGRPGQQAARQGGDATGARRRSARSTAARRATTAPA